MKRIAIPGVKSSPSSQKPSSPMLGLPAFHFAIIWLALACLGGVLESSAQESPRETSTESPASRESSGRAASPIAEAGGAAVQPPRDAAGQERASEDTASRTGTANRQGLIASLTIFVLAIFVGFELITKVPPTLHTPLMSGSNAISGITLVGAVIVASAVADRVSPILGFVAVVLATVNAVGGFLVTHRMLSMFKR